jgi:hypothetical protein
MGGDRFQVREGAGGDDDVGSYFGEGDGDGRPQPAPGPGDYGYLSVEAELVEDHGASLRALFPCRWLIHQP